MFRWTFRAAWMAILFVAVSTSLMAQQSGSIVGTVADKTGAVIPGAKVTLTDEATKDIRTTTSNGEGFFAFSGTQVGDYTVRVEMRGFRSAETSGVHVSPGDRRSVTVKLEIASTDVSVTVTATADSRIVVDSGDLSSTLSAKDIRNLALTGRDVTELLKTLPGFSENTSYNGVQNKAGYASTVTSVGSGVGNGLSAPGAPDRAGGADLVSDGAHILDPGCACNANQTVNADMVAEVKVTTSAYGADSMTGPVVVSAVGKSGSAEYHGATYLHFRDSSMNSNDWIANHDNVARPNDRYWYPGGQVGGPVPFTHKKLEFFNAYEYYHQSYPDGNNGGILKALVPTMSERAGHFDPTLKDNAAVCGAISSDAASKYRCQPITSITTASGTVSGITNDDISAYIQPGAKAWMKLLPAPNFTPDSGHDYNWIKSLVDTNNGYMYHAKLDYAYSDSTKAYLSFNQQHQKMSEDLMRWWVPADAIDTPGGVKSETTSRTFSGSLVKVFNPTTTNEFLAGVSYMTGPSKFDNQKAMEKTALGYPYKFPGNSPLMPSLENAWWSTDLGIPMMMDTDRVSSFSRKMQPSIADNFTKIVGTHTVKAGVSWLRSGNRQANVDQTTGQNGTVAYGPTGNCWGGPPIPSTCNAVVNLMTDLAGNFSTIPDTVADMYDASLGFYVQDEWKATKRLTLDFGIRMQHETPWQSVTGKYGAATFSQAWYDADIAAKGSAAILPGLRWHGMDNSVSVAGHSLETLNYGPRFGLAYDYFGDGKTVIRGGFGSYFYHDNLSGYDNANGVAMGGTSCGINGTATLLSDIDKGKNVSCSGVGSGVTKIGDAVDRNDSKQPNTMTYNLTLSQQTVLKSLLEITYSGSQSTNLINPLTDINITPVGAYMQKDTNPSSPYYNQVVPIDKINSNSSQVQQDFKPYPLYTNLNIIRHRAWSNYNALQVSWSKHTGSLSYNLNYTWSKMMGIGSQPDPINLHHDYGILSQDRTHVFNASYAYEVGNRFRGKILGYAANGWMISGITGLQSGVPMQQAFSANLGLAGSNTVTDSTGKPANNNVSSTYYLGTATGYSLMPKLTCDPSSGRKNDAYINASCFALPDNPVFDSSNRLIQLGGQGPYQMPLMHGPAFFDTDLAVSRTIRITEHQNAQFKVNALNFINHPLKSFDQTNANNLNLNFTDGVLKTQDTGWAYGVTNEKFGRRVVEVSFRYNF